MESLKFDVVRIGSVIIKYLSPVFNEYTELFTYTIWKVGIPESPIFRYVLKDTSFAFPELNWDNYSYVDYKIFDSLDALKAYIKDYSSNHSYKVEYDGDLI